MLWISTSGFDAERRQQIEAKVSHLGGIFQPHLVKEETTHLIVKRVGTRKYLAAVESGIKIIKVQWVEDSVEAGIFLPTNKYSVGMFYGLIVCSTGLDRSEKSNIRKIVEEGNGKYVPGLVEDANYLVSNSSDNQKVELALGWRIKVVTSAFFEACHSAGRFLRAENYFLDVKPKVEKRPLSDGFIQTKVERSSPVKKAKTDETIVINKLTPGQFLESFKTDESKIKSVQGLLVGHQIFLHGCGKDTLTWLHLCSLTGASVYLKYHKNITHVVIGDQQDNEYVNYLVKAAPGVEFTHISWIQACLMQLKPLPSGNFGNTNDKTPQDTKQVKKICFENKYICVSQYGSSEKKVIENLATRLGAQYIERLFKSKAANTFLISPHEKGMKCERALEWGIPIFTVEWLRTWV